MISLANVTKRFGENVVLENINLRFEKGKIHGVVGKNGVGKTVLFKLICGFMPPTSGDIVVKGQKIRKDIDFPASCGIIIETPGFINTLSGFKNLKLLSDINGKIPVSKIKELMAHFGLDPEDKRSVKKYSLGMKQKLGIIQAVMEDQEILILDEPMNSLDEGSVEKVRRAR
ncbi:MAG: ATP-binding cassette domain-containing protein [Peptococcaceae bacterium]|nr:ATP-binding cassette domain-containing protein [Peptococcaceae bacterium]